MYIVPKQVSMSGEHLINYYKAREIDISDGTPAHLQIIVEMGHVSDDIGVQHFIIGGEALPAHLVQQMRTKWQGYQPKISNVYGPTECCVDATAYTIEEDVSDVHTVPIGKPLANQSIYILDSQQKMVPIGVVGEVYIGGAGVQPRTHRKGIPGESAKSGRKNLSYRRFGTLAS
ncbi:AMP-binding protein [Caldalkalibacillus mannanilyticus]|uniref:AMP-binding protein n=1 Tax=Caldalkalibacillus mannanilyticus TaxID=1418 RepID=UPI000687CF24